jgi:NAD(P)-dependent dehydrogenase (short-subunit alcohol dehydrogenase family)
MGRKAVALQLDTGEVAASPFADRLRAALRETWSRETFDHLVNNAGHGDYALIADTTEAQFDGLVNVHFKGVFFLTQDTAATDRRRRPHREPVVRADPHLPPRLCRLCRR